MLVLTEPRADLCERFRAGDLDLSSSHADLTDRVDGRQRALWLRELNPVLERWGRSRASGLCDDGPAHVEGISDLELRERRERLHGLLRADSALLGPIAKDFAARSLLSVLADRDGVVLHRHGGGAFSDAAAMVRLVEGARWSEDVRGTNAIGTALVEQQPIAVLGGAHFERKNAGLFCYATPVRDIHGELVCVLDVTGPIAMHDAGVGVAVRAAGSALELVLRMHALSGAVEGGLRALTRVVERLHEPAFVVDVRGEVLSENARARSLLRALSPGESDPQLAGYIASWQRAAERSGRLTLAPAAAPPAPGRAALASHGARGLTLEPIRGADGRVIALLVVASAQHTETHRKNAPPPTPEELPAFRAIVGDDPVLQREKARALTFARTELPVLLLAETGTGKELFARAIHAASVRGRAPFVALNCATVTDSLLESELFGHAPHAFTGASRGGTAGKLAAAHGGTLFLDEIADMPGPLQAALLRFLDDGSYYRVGESKPQQASVRLICATCRDLPALVRAGRFRQDLFFRIQGACVRPPALRLRSDRVRLAEQLLTSFDPPKTLTRAAAEHVSTHSWPGNVRELKSALLHASALASGHLIELCHLPEPLLVDPPWCAPINSTNAASLSDAARQQSAEGAAVPQHDATERVRPRSLVMKEAVDEAVRVTGGNLSEAARRLHMARSTLYRILRS